MASEAMSLVQRLRFIIVCYLFLSLQGVNAIHAVTGEQHQGELLYDRSPPPLVPRIMLLQVRQDSEPSTPSSVMIRPDDVSAAPTATRSNIQTATETTTSLPTPFDSNIGNNFTTTSCPNFFDRFLHNQTFNDCLPFSLLLQTSNGFFTASRSNVRLARTLDATCNVDFAQCSALMASLALEIRQTSNCASDLAMNNPTVVQAYNGFLAYDTLYHAGCLTDSDGAYCYANAVTNVSAPSSSYIYYLPLGVTLPGGSRPACTSCLQNTMAIFAQSAGNKTQPLSGGYGSAASVIQMTCGPTFVQTAVQRSSAAIGVQPFFGFTGSLALLGLFLTI